MNLPVNQVILGDCTEVMKAWPDDSIDLVVTSPPYWGLRDYGSETVKVWGGRSECEHEWAESESGLAHENRNFSRGSQEDVHGERETTWIRKYDSKKAGFCVKCGAWRGSLGLEPHPQLFIDHIIEICREIKRVLKPSGTFWLNLGDTYYGSHAGKIPQAKNPNVKIPEPPSSIAKGNWLQPKQLLGMPWRIAIALQHDGWILRNDIIWHKPNHMPSSVKDRLTCAYEHVFLFAKQRRYYFDLDAIRKPVQKSDYKNYEGKLLVAERSKQLLDNRDQLGKPNHPKGKNPGDVWDISKPIISNSRKELHGPTYRRHQIKIEGGQAIGLHPLGKNPGDLWEVEEEKLTKHDRAVGRINRSYTDSLHTKRYDLEGKNPGDVLSGSKYLEQDHPHSIRVKGGHTGDYTHLRGKNPGDLWRIPTMPFKGAHFAVFPPKLIEPIIKAGSPKGGVVLDPFAGSGTVGQVARRLGRRFILIEIIPEYCEIAEQRIRGKYRKTPEGVTPLTKIWESP